ncbi:uncharacterized protein LOC122048296 [Zingiber officinale]|uniref:uncharacterized protein LOC122048296 n=1 Tax=Zingiber officinale TaxID=94328 RepID=UPI001C4A8AAF|nr:uncharacterized protein LOC122048296 [Zingiber officinale]
MEYSSSKASATRTALLFFLFISCMPSLHSRKLLTEPPVKNSTGAVLEAAALVLAMLPRASVPPSAPGEGGNGILTLSNLSKLEFVALDISGKNYLSWILDAEIHLDAMDLGDSIKDGNKESLQNRAKAMIFIRHHLHEALKIEYLTIKDPLELWNNLKERYSHYKTVILPNARYEWIHLRLQDFKSVSEYNSAMFRISSKLKLCGEKITDEDMLEKTYSTFHASNMLLQQQYREKGFKKYSELITRLLVAEQNNELLMKNHEIRPTGASPISEVNEITSKNDKRQHRQKFHHGRGRGRGHGRRYRNDRSQDNHDGYNKRNTTTHQKWVNNNVHQKWTNDNGKRVQSGQDNDEKKSENSCYGYGMKGHWSRTCRTPKYFIDLYQTSLKGKAKDIETNVVFQDNNTIVGLSMTTHLDVSDFFADPDGGIDNLTGNEDIYGNV